MIPEDFFGQVGVPGEQVLTESDVSPEEDEPEQEFTQVVVMFGVDALGQMACLLKAIDEDNQEGEEAYHAPGKVIHAEYRAEIVRFDRREEEMK